MTAPWWVGVGPAEATVACGPNHHRLRWENGTLVAVDHPDPEGEAVLVALGGDEPVCLTLQRHWRAHAADPLVLALAGRHPGDGLTLRLADLLARAAAGPEAGGGVGDHGGPGDRPGSGRRASSWVAHSVADEHLPVLELLALEAGLQRRLQLEVAVNLLAALAAAEPDSPAAASSGTTASSSAEAASTRAILEAATVGRLVPAVRRWSGVGAVDVRIADPGDEPAVVARPGDVAVTVGWDWLTEVWGRYLTVVGGFLVLAVERIVEDRAEVRGVAEPGGDVARLLLRGPAPWHVIQRLE